MWICGGWSGERENKVFHNFVPPFIFWAWLNFFFHGPSCVHFFHGPSCALSFFFNTGSCPYWREFWEKLYGAWNIKEDRNEWLVWKCYSSGVEVFACGVFACGGGVYVILDHE